MTTIPASILPFPAPDGPQPPDPGPRRRGAPPGNQNARKKKRDAGPVDRDLLQRVLDVLADTRGCAREIAMLRFRIHAMFERHVPDEELLRACTVLNRLLITHYMIMDAETARSQEN